MPERIKTLHLTNAWQEQSGGIATFYRALLRAANDQGRELRLIVPGSSDGVEQVGRHARIYYLEAPNAPLNPRYRILYPNQFLFSGSKVQAILAEERPDLIEICDKYNLNYLGALLRLRLLRDIKYRPLVLGLTCERMDENFATYLRGGWFGQQFCSWYMHWLYFPFFDHHVAVSEHTARELAGAAEGHAVQRGVWIRPMGVDVSGLSPTRRSVAKRQQLLERIGVGKDANSFLLLYVGRLAPEKNLSLLLETLECLSAEPGDYRLLLAGDGIERQQLEHMAAQRLPEQVTFLGHIRDRDKLADLYANCDVFLHPNPREPFGIAPMEAMASGLPLVAPDRGGVTSFANPENAWLTGPAGANFAAAVLDVLDSKNENARAAKVEAALRTAQQHSWERITASFFELYDSLVSAFRDERTMESCAPEFLSSAPAPSTKMVAAACAKVAKTAFAGVSNWGLPLNQFECARLPRKRHPLPEISVDSTENASTPPA